MRRAPFATAAELCGRHSRYLNRPPLTGGQVGCDRVSFVCDKGDWQGMRTSAALHADNFPGRVGARPGLFFVQLDGQAAAAS
jgi:hypothetical protein